MAVAAPTFFFRRGHFFKFIHIEKNILNVQVLQFFKGGGGEIYKRLMSSAFPGVVQNVSTVFYGIYRWHEYFLCTDREWSRASNSKIIKKNYGRIKNNQRPKILFHDFTYLKVFDKTLPLHNETKCRKIWKYIYSHF